MKKITLFTLLSLIATVGFSQVVVQDFESADLEFRTLQNIAVETVPNPVKDDANSSDNCMQISSTDGNHQWWALFEIPIDPIATISISETKFLSVMVNYPAQPDLVVRFDANEEKPDGTNNSLARALNVYDSTAPNTWQEIVWEIKDGPNDFAFTLGTLDRIIFHPDVAGKNEPKGRVLSDVTFGYIDNVRILDENPLVPLSVKDASLEDAISIYPSSVTSKFKVTSTKNIKDISLYNILGKSMTRKVVKVSKDTYDISSLSSGMYIVKVTSENGNFITKKIVKE